MAKFNIISQFLKDISFESPNVPELFFKQENNQAKMEINIDLQVKGAENNLFMVDLIVKAHSKLSEGDKSIFLIESTYSGLVQMEEEKDENKDAFSLALERSFGSEDVEIRNEPTFDTEKNSYEDKKEMREAVEENNTDKALNALKKEWQDIKIKPDDKEEDLTYPFGGWTDAENYKKSLRLIILHFSQIFLTEGLTFIRFCLL